MPRLLDLFCGAGGAAVGYARAGFEVVGVDIAPQPSFPFPFVQADVLELPLSLTDFDLVHASPPCQGYSTITHPKSKGEWPRLIEPVREMIRDAGVRGVIENVPGAMRFLEDPLVLRGTMFGLGVVRARYFELVGWDTYQPTHPWLGPSRWEAERLVGVYGAKPDGRSSDRPRAFARKMGSPMLAASSLEEGALAMGIDWMVTWDEVRESIPPAYTQWLGERFLEQR